jgi:hypothetical protein
MFGALTFWPIARLTDRRPSSSYRALFWLFVAQLAISIAWGAWLAILRLAGKSHVEEGLVVLYIAGALFWLVAAVTFVAWYIGGRRTPSEGERVT